MFGFLPIRRRCALDLAGRHDAADRAMTQRGAFAADFFPCSRENTGKNAASRPCDNLSLIVLVSCHTPRQWREKIEGSAGRKFINTGRNLKLP
jgi:hypothetical protein